MSDRRPAAIARRPLPGGHCPGATIRKPYYGNPTTGVILRKPYYGKSGEHSTQQHPTVRKL
jgi:hypothetical protein